MQTDVILQGDCVEVLKEIKSESIDLIFADPPYFMQTNGELLRVEGNAFNGVKDSWDKFGSFVEYDAFCIAWLKECKRVLKKNGTIWVIGSFQNIFRLGYIMQNLGFWVLNDVIWHKSNPVPNFRGTRFCNAHETLIWCAKDKKSQYTFNYKTMKFLNNNKQEKSVWNLALCTGSERLRDMKGNKIHSTQKPESLLERVILSSSKQGDVLLDPFFGTGTSGAIARKLGRHYIGIEQNLNYINAAKIRIARVKPQIDDTSNGALEIKPPKVSLQNLLECALLREGEMLYDRFGRKIGTLESSAIYHKTTKSEQKCYGVRDDSEFLSIHKMAAKHLNKANCNGWSYFYIKRESKASKSNKTSQLISIDSLRNAFISRK